MTHAFRVCFGIAEDKNNTSTYYFVEPLFLASFSHLVFHFHSMISFLGLIIIVLTSTQIKTMAPYDAYKGAPIKVVGGIHLGCKGWIDKTKDPTNDYTHIIVRKNNKTNEEVRTRVRHENYVLKTEISNPVSYEEAMLVQHLDIDALLTKLVQKMAECELADGSNIASIIKQRFEKAKARQENKGSKARWRRVRWPATNQHA